MTRFLSHLQHYCRTSSVVLLIGVLCGLAATTLVAAADQPAVRDSITLSPTSQRFDVQAGATVSNSLTVINDGTAAENVLVYGRPYSVANETYTPNFDHVTANTDVYQWLRLAQTTYSIAPGQTIQIPYELQVPATAAPGGHYGVIFVETQPQTGTTDSVIRKRRVGTIILANVAGHIINQGQVLSSAAPFWQTLPPLTVSSRVQNTGNVDFETGTVLTVKDVFGSVKYKASNQFDVYPGTIRNISLVWPNAPWFGLFRVDQSMTVLGKTTSSSSFVLMTPRWLPITLVILILIGVGYGILRRRKH